MNEMNIDSVVFTPEHLVVGNRVYTYKRAMVLNGRIKVTRYYHEIMPDGSIWHGSQDESV